VEKIERFRVALLDAVKRRMACRACSYRTGTVRLLLKKGGHFSPPDHGLAIRISGYESDILVVSRKDQIDVQARNLETSDN
jgi:hypothetical protein